MCSGNRDKPIRRISLKRVYRLFREVHRLIFSKTGDTRQVVADSNARYYGAILNDESLTPGASPRIGSITFEEWFSTYKPKT